MRTLATMFLLVLSTALLFSAGTTVSGNIQKDSVWTLAGSPYTVNGSVYLQNGFTLRVDSGVVVRFQSGTGLYVQSGTLRARQAVFTSAKDTAGGTPARGDWNSIYVGLSSASTGLLDTCTIRYGGSVDGTLFFLRSGTSRLRGCVITNSSTIGAYAYSGSLTLINTIISNITNQGVVVEPGTTDSLTTCTVGPTNWPIWYNGPAAVTYSGTMTFPGNTHNGAYLNFSSTGNLFLDTLSIPYFMVPGYSLTVNAGALLQIASGNVMKFQGGSLVVLGALRAIAGTGQKIYFTSYRNDNLPAPGFDTNGDGSATAPASQDWGGVAFQPSATDNQSVMRRCSISFAGSGNVGGVSMYGSSPTIDSCDVANSYYGAMMQAGANPVFSNNTIGSSALVPIAISFAAAPVFLNNSFSFSDNQYDAIGLLGGALTTDADLPIRSVTSIPNVTYLMLENVTVPAGKTMTIHKGVVIKAYQGGQRIIVDGKLVANASADSMIVFTSSKDDNYGNPHDTNKDGTVGVPTKGDWSGIVFEGTADSASVLNYCRISFAQLGGTYYNTRYISGGAVTTVNSSPTISNCVIKDVYYAVYAFQASNPKILNDTLANTSYVPVAISVSADPVMSGNTFVNVGWIALGIIGENLGTSGTIKRRDLGGFTNITYVLLEDLTINSGTDVLVQPGVVIKMNSSVGIYVNGGFKAKGTIAGGRIVFTSLKDDNFGNPGDTNGDGAATSASRGDWYMIRFQSTADDVYSLIDSCLIKFGGNGSQGVVSYIDAGVTLSNSTLSDGYYYGVYTDGQSTPLISNVTIQNCRLDPLAMSLKANPTYTNITFAANGSKAIRIIEGTLASNATLAKRDVAGINNIAYIIGNLTINPSAVLTINPGVVLKFSGSYSGIAVQGALIARGTPSSKITFTSIADDSRGGDSNSNGNDTSPNKGDWATVDFSSSSADSLNLLVDCEFRYGGSYNYNNEYGNVRVYNAQLRMDSSSIEQSVTSGIGAFGSARPVISNTSLTNIAYTPVTISMFATPTFTNMTALNIGTMAIGIVPETYSVTATIPVRNFAGYANMTYYLYNWCTINSGTTITIPAGVVFKNAGFSVNGALRSLGTPSSPVVFTDVRDDSYGNPFDTNQDGSSTSPTIGSYYCIQFNDVSTDTASFVTHTVFRYHDVGVALQQASPTITDCLFDRTNWGVSLNSVSNPVVDSCTFKNLTYAPLYISLVSYPVSSNGNVILGTTYRAIGVLANETLVQDVTLTKRNFGGITNIPYVFQNYTIASNSTLTISPGVVLKFFAWTGMTVNKGLIAEGGSTADSTIVFTDLRDDFYGGDTNADSTLTSPMSSYQGWSGITFQGVSLDPLCRLRNVVLRWCGFYSSSGAITTNDASPTISYTSINNCNQGLIVNGSSNPVINYCDLYQLNSYGVNNVNKSFVIDARWNWWGNNTGPTHSGNPGGTGTAVTDAVNYGSFLGAGAMNPVTGDVSLNGAITAFDGSLILKWLVDPVGNPLGTLAQRVADVSGTAGITSYDASLILQYVVGTITGFPAEAATLGTSSARAIALNALRKTARVNALSLSSGSVKGGGRVSMTLSGDGMADLFAGDLEFAVNSAKLHPVDVQVSGGAAVEYHATPSGFRVVFASAKAIQGSGALLTITLEAGTDVRGEVQSPVRITKAMFNEQRSAAGAQAAVTIQGKPTAFGLDQNYPNPFNPTTTITYRVPEDGALVTVGIYSLTGQLVRELVHKQHTAGEYRVVWDATTDNGARVGSGIYFVRIVSDKFTNVRKMILLK